MKAAVHTRYDPPDVVRIAEVAKPAATAGEVGVYVSTDLGPLSLNPLLALVTPLFGGRRVRFPLPRQDPEMARYFKGLIESGQFTPLVDRRYLLEEIVEAYRYVETGQKIGNVVISVQPPSSAKFG